MRKGQVMTEFVIIFGIAVLFFAITIAILSNQTDTNLEQKHKTAVESEAMRINNELLAAYIAKPGYSTTIQFTPPYQGVYMSIYIKGQIAIINSSLASVRLKIPQVKGYVSINRGNITISKDYSGNITVISS